MQVDKIAIIGSGPSGLVALNEFLHTSKNGSSTINSFQTKKNNAPEEPAFHEVVVFEQNSAVGGTWNYSKKTDPAFPSNERDFSIPEKIRQSLESPTESTLKGSSVNNPFTRPLSQDVNVDSLWNKSGVYDDLFTNVPDRLMRFSSGYDIDTDIGATNPYTPFTTHEKVLDYLNTFVEENGLRKHVRFNTTVEKLYKKQNKWVLTVVQLDFETGIEKWYSEEFDAVLVATGRFNFPFIPFVENMDLFISQNPDCISHTKAYRNTDEFKNKKVLLVGSSISAVDLLQYLIPDCREVWLSSNSSRVVIDSHADDGTPGKWMRDILNDKNAGFHRCARIRRFTSDGGVEFEDGQIVDGFEKILFATGYHLFYPFLDIPQNKDKDYIRVLSGKKGQSNYARTKADNAYLYTFTVGEPTLCYIGIAHNPLLFLASEANAIAVAGVWSNSKQLPSVEEQRRWCEEKVEAQTDGLQMFDEFEFKSFVKKLYEYSPQNRIDLLQLVHDNEVDQSRSILKKIFYEISGNTE